jgi:RNA polymerase sigma-70 factor (ECF subfamily)
MAATEVLLDQRVATERFYALVWPHAQTVLRAAKLLLRDPAEAEDIAQETMLKAFRFIESFQEGTDVRAWLMTILRNARTDHLRAVAAHKSDLSWDQFPVEPEDQRTDPAEEQLGSTESPEGLLQRFTDSQVIDALHHLPEEIRWTLLLVDVEGVDHQDAATILGVPVGTVKSRASRGRAMLREALAPLAKDLRLTP